MEEKVEAKGDALCCAIRAIPVPSRKLNLDAPYSPLYRYLVPLSLHDAQTFIKSDARHSPLLMPMGLLQIAHVASSSSVLVCICIACTLDGSSESTLQRVESAAVVCARANFQRASRRRVFVWGLGGGMDVDGCLYLDLVGEQGVLRLVVGEAGVVVGIVVVVCRVLASWQSVSAERKRLMAM